MRRLTRVGVVVLVSCAAILGSTEASVYAAEPQLPMTSIQDGDVEYMSGGISEQERDELEERAYDYRLQLRFRSRTTASVIQTVHVTLTPQSEPGPAVELTTAGPVLLVNMPTGRYKLEARVPGGRAVVQQLVLPGGAIEHVDIALDPQQRLAPSHPTQA